MAPSKKKMSVDFLIQDGESYDKLKKVTFDNGIYTEVYEKFSNVRIDEMLEDFSNFISEYGKTRQLTDKKMIDYINLFILKWFSTCLDFKDNTFEESIVLFEKILKSSYSESIFMNFDKNEVSKVYTRLYQKFEIVKEVMAQSKDVKEQIKEYIMNNDIKNKEEFLKVLYGEDVVSENGDV